MDPNTEKTDCILCGSRDHRVICRKFSLNLVRCKNCRLVFTNPRLIERELFKRYGHDYFYDECLPVFKATSTAFDQETVKNHYSFYINLLKPLHEPGSKLLDVGCGPGFFIKTAERAGWTAEGVEISGVASRYARRVVEVDVTNSSLEEARFPDENFDVVTLLDVIEHLRNPLETLREIHRILNNDGVLLLNTPDLNSLSRFFLGKNWAVLSPAEHLYNFSRGTLKLLLEKARFHILSIQNLSLFNPDYSHEKTGWRHALWKAVCGGIERGRWTARIRSFETAVLSRRLVFFNEKEPPPIPASRLKMRVYSGIKKWFKGDTLIALAKKSGTSKNWGQAPISHT